LKLLSESPSIENISEPTNKGIKKSPQQKKVEEKAVTKEENRPVIEEKIDIEDI
jgi:hypothetical protein